MRVVLASVLLLSAACSSGGDDPSDEITRIDGPAVVDEDEARANNDGTDDPSDG